MFLIRNIEIKLFVVYVTFALKYVFVLLLFYQYILFSSR